MTAILIFFRCLYTDSFEIDHENVSGILYLAMKYDVQHLVEACKSYCTSNITLDDVCTLMNLAYNCNLSKLWSTCLQFIVMNTKSIFPSNYLDNMEKGTMRKFVICDELAVDEILIFECLRSWAKHECSRQELGYNIENERSVLGDIVNYIRFPTMKSLTFTNKIATTNFLTTEEEVDIHRSITSRNKIPSKLFPKSTRLNVKQAFGWNGVYLNYSERKFNAKKKFCLKSVVLFLPLSDIFFLRFQSKKSTEFGSSQIDYLYEIEYPEECVNKYVHVYLPNNGIVVERETCMSLHALSPFIDLNNAQTKGTLEVANVLENIKNDDQLKLQFSLKDLSLEFLLDEFNDGCIKAYFVKF